MSSELQKPVNTDKPAEDSWRVNYITGDLFACAADESMAHCISEDIRMSKGIAVKFKNMFKGVDDLWNQYKLAGQCAVLKREQRFVYYLITKKKAGEKPTYGNLEGSLKEMKVHCLANGVTRISMPRIGCGLDQLQWERVEEILEQVFRDTNISITVYSVPETAEAPVTKGKRRR